MAATVQAQITTGSSTGTAASAEGGLTFGRDDAAASTSPIPKPTTTGTNYSYQKTLHLQVTSGGGSTSLLNRKIRFATAASTGLYGYFKDGSTSYTQSTAVFAADSTASDGALPSTWTALSTTFQNWDTATVSATNSTRNGNFVLVGIGVGSNYAGGAGSAISLPNLELQYDEQ